MWLWPIQGTLPSFVALKYSIRKVHENQERQKLNGRHQVWVFADNVNLLGGNISIMIKATESLLGAYIEVNLEVN
jgi:hypothetical protein